MHFCFENRPCQWVNFIVETDGQPTVYLTDGNIILQIGGILQFHKRVQTVVDDGDLPGIIDMDLT